MVVIGGGGHALATAYYLAKEHGVRNVAVLEKGWLGGGNVGRNTTIVRSNYLLGPNIHFYEHSMKLWEGLEQELNFNTMVSQRGVLNLFHSDGQRDAIARRGNAMRLAGVDAELLDAEQVRRKVPQLDFANARFPILGGLLQPRGVRCAMTPWPGATPAPPMPWVWTSSKTARSRAFASKAAALSAWTPAAGISEPARWRRPWPDTPQK